jgi:hypothetical protein
MGNFTLDIKGQLNSMKLSESNALWPLFETVVNAIQAIEDSPNKDAGKIEIFVHRNCDIQNLENNEQLAPIESFTVTDNGVGFNKDNYLSFNTAYSTYKFNMGCKGIGRFLWLLAFDSVEIESYYVENGQSKKRQFKFTSDGVFPDNNCVETVGTEYKTIVNLIGYASIYQSKCPVNLDVLAHKIVEHCLPFLLSDTCPEIVLKDGMSDSINLNSYFKATIKPSLHQDHFSIKGEEFVLYHLKIPEGATKHELHFCANLQEVETVELKNYIPELQKKIIPINEPLDFYYLGYLTSPYLDSNVSPTRTGFDFDEIYGQTTIVGTGKDELVTASVDFIKGYLADYITNIKKRKREQIDTFVAQDKPQYRYLLSKKPEIYDDIPAGLSPDKLELELHKKMQSWELEIKEQGQKLKKETLCHKLMLMIKPHSMAICF